MRAQRVHARSERGGGREGCGAHQNEGRERGELGGEAVTDEEVRNSESTMSPSPRDPVDDEGVDLVHEKGNGDVR